MNSLDDINEQQRLEAEADANRRYQIRFMMAFITLFVGEPLNFVISLLYFKSLFLFIWFTVAIIVMTILFYFVDLPDRPDPFHLFTTP